MGGCVRFRAFPVLMESFCFDAFSSREPVSTSLENALAPGVAGPGADDAFLAAEFVAFARGGIERGRNPRLDRIAMGAAGIGEVDRQRGAGAFHGNSGAITLALLERRGLRSRFRRKIMGLAIGAALADSKCPGRRGLRDEIRSGKRQYQRCDEHRAARQNSQRSQSPIPPRSSGRNLASSPFHLVNERLKMDERGEPKCVSMYEACLYILGHPFALTLAPLRIRKRLGRIDIEERADPFDRDFSHRFTVLRNQVACADVAIERHQFLEEAA
jgi:hypothetical protein